jgi:hypothetical protein
MAKTSGIDRRGFVAGTFALGTVGAAAPRARFRSGEDDTTATIDGLEVNYVTHGAGPALLMLAPGGFDATMEKWTTAGVRKGMRPLDALANDFTVIAYDRRKYAVDSANYFNVLSFSYPTRVQ